MVKGMRSRERESKLFHRASLDGSVEANVAHGQGNDITSHTPISMCILIRSGLKVLHEKWSFQTRHSAFKLLVALEVKRVKFTPLNSFFTP